MKLRSHAYLALLGHAATVAIETGRLDPLAPNREPMDPPTSVLLDAPLGSIPMRVSLSGWRANEARIAIAAWPTPDVDQWVAAMNAKALAGDVTAIGYVERTNGRLRLMLSSPFDPLMFIRRDRMDALKMLPRPDDAADPFQLYPRYLSYAAAA